jgi:hypothetical protein
MLLDLKRPDTGCGCMLDMADKSASIFRTILKRGWWWGDKYAWGEEQHRHPQHTESYENV